MKTFTKDIKLRIKAIDEGEAERKLKEMMREVWAEGWYEEKEGVRKKCCNCGRLFLDKQMLSLCPDCRKEGDLE